MNEMIEEEKRVLEKLMSNYATTCFFKRLMSEEEITQSLIHFVNGVISVGLFNYEFKDNTPMCAVVDLENERVHIAFC